MNEASLTCKLVSLPIKVDLSNP